MDKMNISGLYREHGRLQLIKPPSTLIPTRSLNGLAARTVIIELLNRRIGVPSLPDWPPTCPFRRHPNGSCKYEQINHAVIAAVGEALELPSIYPGNIRFLVRRRNK
jgi:hypothetical protein